MKTLYSDVRGHVFDFIQSGMCSDYIQSLFFDLMTKDSQVTKHG